MSNRVDPTFIDELKRYGYVQVESCFNCGNCSAVCPLSTENENFPRKMIRYAQLGLKDDLTKSKELWMCYYCGECTATCPRQADPGEYMAAARRYAIASYDRLGLAKRLYTSPVFNVLFFVVISIVFGMFLYSYHGEMPLGDSLALFSFIPSEVIHNLGIIAGVIISIVAILGMTSMAGELMKLKAAEYPEGTRFNRLKALWNAVVVESLGQKRYREDCETYARDQKPWYLQRWFVHASMLWGFIGLFVATALNYLLELVAVKPTGTWVPLWYPIRLLGIIAGLLLVYGSTVFIVRRLTKYDEMTTYTTPSDWSFVILLWLAGVTGFALDLAIYLPKPYAWGYWMLLIHLVVIGDLLLLAPFTKFAHAIYRMIALFFHALEPVPVKDAASQPATGD